MALALSALALGCGTEPTAAPAPGAGAQDSCPALERLGAPKPRNVVFVLSDTMRRDRIGVYGGPARTPHMDRFAREHVWFTAAETQAPWTKPSIATLFTGAYPSQHAVLSHPRLRGAGEGGAAMKSDVLSSEWVTLAEALRDAGYRTAAIVSNPWLQPALGFAQGFETYDETLAANDTPGSEVTAAAADWLRQTGDDDRPWFLYVHYMDAHSPYAPVPPERLRERATAIYGDRRPVSTAARQKIRVHALHPEGLSWTRRGVPPTLALLELVYDYGVELFDDAFGVLLAELAARPDWDDTALILTSDHGEALFHRGWSSHGYGLHGDETGVPLLMRLPGVSADGPVTCPAGLVDLRQTLCDYLGVPCPGRDFGASLIRGAAGPRYAVSEGVIHRPRHRSIRDRRYKLLWQPGGLPRGALSTASNPYSLFDLSLDPDEHRDLLGTSVPDPEAVAHFDRLRAALPDAVSRAPSLPRSSTTIDDATRKRLEALGYVGE